ncbi:M3 family oligoendopeptidase [bacterium]|nr:M3 family oligoendopeptidase [bacterium]
MAKTVRRARQKSGQSRTGRSLPSWDLSDLYRSPDDARISRAVRKSLRDAEAFRKRYAGKIERYSRKIADFRLLMEQYEALMCDAVKPYHYASLLFAESAVRPGAGALLQEVKTRFAELSNTMAFFQPELLSLPRQKLLKLAKSPQLAEYRNFLHQLLQYKKHELVEREKQIFTDLSLTGRSAIVRIYDEEFATRRYEIAKGKKTQSYSLDKALDLLHSSDRSVRKAAHAGLSTGLIEDSRRLTLLFNTLLQDKEIRDRYHAFENPEDSRHLDNQTSREAVDSLVKAVRGSYRDVARFYEFKRDLLGYRELFDYDRYAPIVRARKISWPKAKEMVIDAFTAFHPEFGRIASEFFEKGWIDAADREGKRGGAFCSFLTPDLHPYVFMNFSGTESDLFTLAHELGHAIHAYLMREQSYVNFDTPLTIAETASIFAELVLFEHLKERTRSEDAILSMSLRHIEGTIATVHRQISMFQFERDAHGARRKGELSTEDLNGMWRARQEEMFRGAVTITPEYDSWWSYVPHFVHTPFYVYAYSFGQLLALSLFERYRADTTRFPEKYIEFLASGNSRTPQELGKRLGVNLNRPDVWQQGVKSFRKRVREVEGL